MLLKFSKWLEIIAFKLKQKSIYFELKHHIKIGNPFYLMHTHYWTRGIGKSYTLLQLAHKYKCPIVVGTDRMGKNLRLLNRKCFKKDIQYIVANNHMMGKRFDLLLCEEGVDRNLLGEVIRPMCKQLIGFRLID